MTDNIHQINSDQLKKEIKTNMRVGLNTMIWGGPGIGKSEIPQQVADELNCKLLDFRANLFDPVDVRGVPYVSNADSGKFTSWAAPDIFPIAERDGDIGIFLIDELPTAPPATQNAFLQLLLTRQVGDYTMPDGWSVISAGNRLTDAAAVYQMPSPVRNRLMHYELEPNINTWCDWALQHDVDSTLVSFLRFKPNLLYSFKADEYAFPTPRSWSFVDKRLKLEKDHRDDSMFFGASAAVGNGPAGEFVAFAKIANELPDIDYLIENPHSYKPTTDPAVMYALTGAVASRAEDAKMDKIMAVNKKLPTEFQVVLVKTLLAKDKSLFNHASVQSWVSANANVIL